MTDETLKLQKREISERIEILRNLEGYTKMRQFAEVIGIKYTTYFSQATDGTTSIDTILSILEKFPNTSIDWLISGRGNRECCVSEKNIKEIEPVESEKEKGLINTDNNKKTSNHNDCNEKCINQNNGNIGIINTSDNEKNVSYFMNELTELRKQNGTLINIINNILVEKEP